MARGLHPHRRSIKSPVESVYGAQACVSGPAKTSMDESDNVSNDRLSGTWGCYHVDSVAKQDLGSSINQAIQLQGGKQVKAFVLMTLDEDGSVSTHTATKHVQQCTSSIFARDAEDRLRFAHRASLLEGAPGYSAQHNDLLSPGLDAFATRFGHRTKGSSRGSATRTSQTAQNEDWTADSASNWSGTASESAHTTTVMDVSTEIRSRCAPPLQYQSLRVCEASKIETFVSSRLRRMQQLAVKRIAKAWIKGICPKKQAFFPYHKKKRERALQGGEHISEFIPGWWPATNVCRFVEPDHIKRDERINLCLHLLRLRPEPAQLKKWNNHLVEPHQTHLTKGWTEFLFELAPPGIFDEMREPDGKTTERQKLLGQIYDLARKEEAFKNNEIDATDQFWYEPDDEDKFSVKRKGRRSHEVSTDESDAESLTDDAPMSKRPKRASEATTPARSPVVMQAREHGLDDIMQDCKPAAQGILAHHESESKPFQPGNALVSSNQGQWSHYQIPHDLSADTGVLQPIPQQIQAAHGLPCAPQAYTANPPWTEHSSPESIHPSIGSSSQSMNGSFIMEGPASNFPGHHDYQFPQAAVSQAHAPVSQTCPTYMANHFPRPQLEHTSANSPHAQIQPEQVAQHSQYGQSIYYSQPTNAQSHLFDMPGTAGADAKLHMVPQPDMSYQHCQAGQEQCYSIGSSNYQHQPEPSHPAYPYSEFHNAAHFYAPARVERGFTGHGSGVGGGAHT